MLLPQNIAVWILKSAMAGDRVMQEALILATTQAAAPFRLEQVLNFKAPHYENTYYIYLFNCLFFDKLRELFKYKQPHF